LAEKLPWKPKKKRPKISTIKPGGVGWGKGVGVAKKKRAKIAKKIKNSKKDRKIALLSLYPLYICTMYENL